MVGHANRRHINVVPLVGGEVRRRAAARQAEGGHLGDHAAEFGADIKAGADLARDAGSVDGADLGLLLDVDVRGAGVADGQEDERARSGLDKGIVLAEVEVADVGDRHLLGAGQHCVVVGVSDQVVDLVLVGHAVVGLNGAGGRQHETVTDHRPQSVVGVNLNVGGRGNERLNKTRSAKADVLTAFLGAASCYANGQQKCK